MANSIETGRTPWLEEPSCRTCHTERFGEPVGQLFRQSTGHGGVMCEGCHNSTHAEWPSSRPEDNANIIALQGTAGPLADCRVCHTVNPTAPGPHGIDATTDVADEVLAGGSPMQVWPNPMREGCRISFTARQARSGHAGDLRCAGADAPAPAAGARGDPAACACSGTGAITTAAACGRAQYFARWQQGEEKAAARITVVN